MAGAGDQDDVETLRRKLREKEKLLEVQNVRAPDSHHRMLERAFRKFAHARPSS